MIKIDMRYFGGRGASGASGGGSAISKSGAKALAFGVAKSEQKELYYHSALNETTMKYYAEKNPKAFEDETKLNSVLVNESLPKLTGSEKQVNWANNLRSRALTNTITKIYNTIPESSPEKRRAAIKEFSKHGFKSKSYSDVVNHVLKRSKEYKELSSETSASKIIDKYR